LLLDEPLASLDTGLKEKIIPYLRRVRDEFSIPMLYVSHDPTEVLALADWVIVLSHGRLLVQGIPGEVLMSRLVLSHMEEDQVENVLNARLIDSDPKAGQSRVSLESGQELFIPYIAEPAGRSLQVLIRGDEILVARKRPEEISASNIFRGVVARVETGDGQALLKVDAGDSFYVRLTPSAVEKLGLASGAEVFLIIKTRSCRLL
jgi:molybdate transport system ATP-binding protein